MDFKNVIQKEKENEEKQKVINTLKAKLTELKTQICPNNTHIELETKVFKQKLLKEYINYFTEIGFDEVTSVVKENHPRFREVEKVSASIGKYKTSIMITKDNLIFLEVQHTMDYGTDEYRLTIDVSSESGLNLLSDDIYNDLDKKILALKQDIETLKGKLSENLPLKIICKFDDGQMMNRNKEYDNFFDIIKDIPEVEK